ncbi:MAG: hypothetical protein ACT4P2_00790 [Pseudomonadota bacterium]
MRVSWSVFPLLALVVIAYNAMALIFAADFDAPRMAFALPSGGTLAVSWGALLVVAGLVAMFVEIVKSTRMGSPSIIDHGLSMAVFTVCLVEFLLVPAMATATFVTVMLMALIDVVAGFTVSISAARRDIALSERVEG